MKMLRSRKTWSVLYLNKWERVYHRGLGDTEVTEYWWVYSVKKLRIVLDKEGPTVYGARIETCKGNGNFFI